MSPSSATQKLSPQFPETPPAPPSLERLIPGTSREELAFELLSSLPREARDAVLRRLRSEALQPVVDDLGQPRNVLPELADAAGEKSTTAQAQHLAVPDPPALATAAPKLGTARPPRPAVSAFRTKKGPGMLRTLRELPRELYEETVRRLGYGQCPQQVALGLLDHPDAGAIKHLTLNSVRQYLQVLDEKIREHDENRGARNRSIREQAKQLLQLRQQARSDQTQDLAEIETEIRAIAATLEPRYVLARAFVLCNAKCEELYAAETLKTLPCAELTKLYRQLDRIADGLGRTDALSLRRMKAEKAASSRRQYSPAALTRIGDKVFDLLNSIHVNAAGILENSGNAELLALAGREILIDCEEAGAIIKPLRSA